MRTSILGIASVILVVSSGPGAAGQERENPVNGRAIANLLIAVKSDNAGLRESAAFLLGEFKSERAVIPLMGMLKEDQRPSARAVAALALCRIGDERGVFAIRRAVRFDEDQGVKELCAWYYNEYVEPGTYAFIAKPEGAPAMAGEFTE
jgi:hypothetical protein